MKLERHHLGWIGYGVLVAMNLLDLWFTGDFLLMGAEEVNPFMNWIYQAHGMMGMAVVKGIGLGIAFGAFHTYPFLFTKNYIMVLFYLVVFSYTCLTFYHLWMYLNLAGVINT